jgi:hypothetical protein
MLHAPAGQFLRPVQAQQCGCHVKQNTKTAAFVLCSEFKHIISDHEMLLMQGFTGNAETKRVDK